LRCRKAEEEHRFFMGVLPILVYFG
jgi:hypothetical protein